MKIELTTQEAIQLIKEHLSTSNVVEVSIISEQVAKDEDKERNKRRNLIEEVKTLLKSGSHTEAIVKVMEAIPSLELKDANAFVSTLDTLYTVKSTVIKTPVTEESEKETREHAKDKAEGFLDKQKRAEKERRRTLVVGVQTSLRIGDKMNAIKLVNQTIMNISLSESKRFVEMNEREFNNFIDTGDF
jgi:hypothetical protein